MSDKFDRGEVIELRREITWLKARVLLLEKTLTEAEKPSFPGGPGDGASLYSPEWSGHSPKRPVQEYRPAEPESFGEFCKNGKSVERYIAKKCGNHVEDMTGPDPLDIEGAPI